jgi:hypothetical protein
MRKTKAIIISAMLVFFAFGSKAQSQPPKDPATGAYIYQDVVIVDSATKQQLYTKAKSWILKTLKSGDNIIQLDDKHFNSITGSGTIIMNKIGTGFMSYSYDNA